MENTNEMKIVFDSRPENEGLARVAVAAFCTQLNPTLEEVSDLKTAVSEAVTNCIIHAYEGKVQKIEVRCRMQGRVIWVDVIDKGIGIENISKAMEPMFTKDALLAEHALVLGAQVPVRLVFVQVEGLPGDLKPGGGEVYEMVRGFIAVIPRWLKRFLVMVCA